MSGSVDDANYFNAVFDGSIEDCVAPHGEMPEIRCVFFGTRSDLRMVRVKLARLVKLDREAVRCVGPLAVQVIEDSFQVLLSLCGADGAGHQAPPLAFRRRLRTFASVPWTSSGATSPRSAWSMPI
jgi:hypothetical protein